eukprot:293154-Pelagomonas_calceolata.AAC.4
MLPCVVPKLLCCAHKAGHIRHKVCHVFQALGRALGHTRLMYMELENPTHVPWLPSCRVSWPCSVAPLSWAAVCYALTRHYYAPMCQGYLQAECHGHASWPLGHEQQFAMLLAPLICYVSYVSWLP